MESLSEVKGIGPKKLVLYQKIGISTVEDLISYYPYRYEFIKVSDMSLASSGMRVIVEGILEGYPIVRRTRTGIKKINFRINTSSSFYQVCVFHQDYLCRILSVGDVAVVIGKYDRERNLIIASSVEKGSLGKETRVDSIYYQTPGLSMRVIGDDIWDVLNQKDFVPVDYLPGDIKSRYHFMDKLDALKEIHRPTGTKNYLRARQRLKYEELFVYLSKIYALGKKRKNEESSIFREIPFLKVNDFIQTLPFELTVDQQKTVLEIYQDLCSSIRMNRLVQGDVGSGKTIVAFIAVYINFLSHYQSAFMVPTEILARQHYHDALSLFKNTDIEIALLTSSVSKKEKKDIYQKLKNHEIDLVIGTQSLIQEDLVFSHLGLVVLDEQHRFGVNQREVLKNKGEYPDILSMSATPIPRTYALALYGDIDVSNIKTKPSGRKKVITKVFLESKIKEVLYLMKKEIDLHHQIYIIAPSIFLEGEENLDNVMEIYEKMKLAFSKIASIGVVHGKMDPSLKQQVMRDFEKGDLSILISTTVIEVGVNVPNASMIVIFQANLFGLSTLHQLRGRVGRGDIQSYCFLISKKPDERLAFLENTSDGFLVSEYDFQTRGSGDLFGIRQSGDANFKLVDIKSDFELFTRVKEDVLAYMNFS